MKAAALLLTLASIAIVGVVADVTVKVRVKYPQSNLGTGQYLALRGSYPISWTSDTTLSNPTADHWEANFTIASKDANATFNPMFQMALKIIVHPDAIWELGANHRFDVPYAGDASTPGVFTFDLFPYFETTRGSTMTLKSVHSPQLNNSRDVWLYIPPVMVENTYAWAKHVLIMHDGQNLQPTPNSPPDWMGNWSVATHIDNAIERMEVDQIFVVGPYNTGANRINEYTYSYDPKYGGGEGDLYLDFLTTTLLPKVKETFPQLKTEKKHLGIMGSSLGGLISCYAGITRPSVYSTVGCMSSSFWWNHEDFMGTIIPKLTDSASQQYYVDCGDSGDGDDDLQDTSIVSTAFLSSKKNLTLGKNFFWFLQRGGEHNEYFWSQRFHHPVLWLYGHRAVWNNGVGYDSSVVEKGQLRRRGDRHHEDSAVRTAIEQQLLKGKTLLKAGRKPL